MSTNSSPSRGSARTGLLLAAAAVLGGGAWFLLRGKSAPPPPAPKTPGAYSRPAYAGGAAGGTAAPVPSFVDVAEAAGVRFVHENGARGRKFLPETLGSGAAVLDFDGDGRMDLLLVNGRPWAGDPGTPAPSRLLRNRGDGTFEDATERAGLGAIRYGMGAAVADYDGDGDPDVFVTAVGPQALYRNDGGRFTDVAVAAGVAGDPWKDDTGAVRDPFGSCAAFLDYDADGILDLYAGRYVRWCPENDVFSSLDGKNKAYTIPDRYRGDSGRLYRGRGDGTFEDVTDRAGVRKDEAKALGVVACDLDGDGRTDIAVANDGEPNHLFRNRGDGTFEEIGLAAGLAYDAQGRARADMGIAAAVVDDGGSPVVVTGTFSQEPLGFYRRTKAAKGLAYVEEGPQAGVASPTFPSLTFGVLLEDLDLDGRPDIVLANGHIEPTIQTVMREIPYAQAPQFFRNLGGGRFEDASARAGPAFAVPSVGRGLAWLDLEGDGDPDLVMTENGRAARLLRNDAPAGRRSLRIRLEGTGGNRDALGAVVRVTAGGRERVRERSSGGSYLSESEPTLLFGLGEAEGAENVVVRWPGPGGAEQALGALEAGLWRVRRGGTAERIGE